MGHTCLDPWNLVTASAAPRPGADSIHRHTAPSGTARNPQGNDCIYCLSDDQAGRGEHTHSSRAARCRMIYSPTSGPDTSDSVPSKMDDSIRRGLDSLSNACACMRWADAARLYWLTLTTNQLGGQRLNSRARASPSGKVRRASARLSGRAAVRPFEMPPLKFQP